MAEKTVFDNTKDSREFTKRILLHSSATNFTPGKIITDSRLAQFKNAVNAGGAKLSAEDYLSLYLVDKVSGTKLGDVIDKSRGILDTNQQKFLLKVAGNIDVLEKVHPDLVKNARQLNKDVDKIELNRFSGIITPQPGSNVTLESIDNDLYVKVENPEQEERDIKTLKANQDFLKNFLESSKEKYFITYPEKKVAAESTPSYKVHLESGVGESPQLPYGEEGFPSSTIRGVPSGGINAARSSIRQGIKAAGAATGAAIGNAVAPVIGTTLGKVGAWAGDLVGQAATDPIGFLKRMAKYAVIIAGFLATVATGWIIQIIIGIVIFIFLVVIILFIINSGAYIVPQGGFTQAGQNAYIKITKTVDNPGPFDNSWADSSRTLNYTITIYALRGNLTNISFNYSCDVISKQAKSCPVPRNITAGGVPSTGMPPNPPSIITASQPFVITYSTTLRGGGYYHDSLITDIFTVTATVEDHQESVKGARSIRIGNPPDMCPSGWPIMPEGDEEGLTITQTMDTVCYNPGDWCSHHNAEAIDVGASPGHIITARHSGIIHVNPHGLNTGYGCYVEIESTCNGESFISRYGHLTDITVADGQTVNLGDEIGLSGGAKGDPCQGNSSGAHLHYEFGNGVGLTKLYPDDPPPFMETGYNWNGQIFDFIPHSVPRECAHSCGTIP